jgi:hypothetical protein
MFFSCRRRFLSIACIFLGALLAPNTVFAKNKQKVAQEFQQAGADERVDVIVQYNQIPSEKEYKKIKDKGGKLKTER